MVAGLSAEPEAGRVRFAGGPPLRVVDMTHPLGPDAPRSTDHPEVTFGALRWRSLHGSSTHTIHASLHSGTHIDAPSLYLPQGQTVDRIPPERLVGPGVIVDVRTDDWGVIDVPQLETAEPAIEPGDIVILYTGWSRFYGVDEQRYVLRQPGLSKAAVDWLIGRRVNMVGADQPSAEHIYMRLPQWRERRPDIFADVRVDPAQWPRSYGHKSFFDAGILMIDHVGGDVALAAGRRCTIGAFVARYAGMEAAPCRLLAFVE